jgi:PAS domain S-box-containing protein
MDSFQVAVRQLYGEELQLLVHRNAEVLQRLGRTKSILLFGTILGLLITAAAGWTVQRDGSRRRQAEEALRASEQQYQLALEEIQDYAIFRMDSRGRVISWNGGAERIKGYSADQIVGQDFACFFSPEDIARSRPAEILRLAAENGRYEEQGMRVRKDGSRFPANIAITALRDAAGILLGFSEFSHDLSESKKSVG